MAQPKIQKGTTATGAQASSVHLDEPPRTVTGNRLRAGRGLRALRPTRSKHRRPQCSLISIHHTGEV